MLVVYALKYLNIRLKIARTSFAISDFCAQKKYHLLIRRIVSRPLLSSFLLRPPKILQPSCPADLPEIVPAVNFWYIEKHFLSILRGVRFLLTQWDAYVDSILHCILFWWTRIYVNVDVDDCDEHEAAAGCGRTGLRNATCNPPLHNSDFQNGDKQNLLKHVF